MTKLKKPLIILKQAMSCDGFLDSSRDNKSREVFSNDKDYLSVQRLRSRVDAILVGSGTLINDNPSLTVRESKFVAERIALNKSAQPLRVVLLGKRPIPHGCVLPEDGLGPVLILKPEAVDLSLDGYSQVTVVSYKGTHLEIELLCQILSDHSVSSLLVEGGANLALQFIEGGFVDLLRLAYSPKLVLDNNATKILPLSSKIISTTKPRIENLESMYAVWYALTEEGNRFLETI